MNRFVRRHLDPVDRLGEALFGIIMALGFTAAVRLGHEEADSRALFVGILGCNVAWGIVDGVMYVLAALFERGREAQFVREVLSAPTDEAARECVARQMDDSLLSHATEEERRRYFGWVVETARRAGPPKVSLRSQDLLGAAAVALIILMATAPMLVPYFVFRDAEIAVRVSNVIGLALLFLVGAQWGGSTGTGVWRVGLGVTLVGAALVAVTVALGG